MSCIDTLAIAKDAITRILAAYPQMVVNVNTLAPVELSVDIPVQSGLNHAINLNLQNEGELQFNVGSFTLEWFPCSEHGKVEAFVNAVVGFISGRLRILEHYRGSRCVMAELQEPCQTGWMTIGVYYKLHIPFPWKIVQKVIHNG